MVSLIATPSPLPSALSHPRLLAGVTMPLLVAVRPLRCTSSPPRTFNRLPHRPSSLLGLFPCQNEPWSTGFDILQQPRHRASPLAATSASAWSPLAPAPLDLNPMDQIRSNPSQPRQSRSAQALLQKGPNSLAKSTRYTI